MFAFLGLILAVVVLDAVQGTDLSHIKMLTMDVSSEDQDIVVGLSAQLTSAIRLHRARVDSMACDIHSSGAFRLSRRPETRGDIKILKSNWD